MEDRKKTCSTFAGRTNYRSKKCGEFLGGVNCHSKISDKSSSTANYRSQICVDQNRHHKNAGKFPQNIVASEISSKSQEQPGISSVGTLL